MVNTALKNKHILITGGTSGLGLSLTSLVVSLGAKVTILTKNPVLPESIKDNADAITLLHADISDGKNLKEVFPTNEKIDILINCAGKFLLGNFHEYSFQEIEDIINTNLLGLLYVTNLTLQGMKNNNSGVIINISSSSSRTKKARQTVYVASKCGVSGFTESLQKELEETDIKVIDFCPGAMDTPIFAKAGMGVAKGKLMNPDNVAQIIVETIVSTQNGCTIESILVK